MCGLAFGNHHLNLSVRADCARLLTEGDDQ